VLTEDLLSRLEGRWRSQDAPLLASLQAGLDDDQIAEAVRPLGLRLPVEARIWWRWHDGVPVEAIRFTTERTVGPRLDYLPLAEAVRTYRTMVELARKAVEAPAGLPAHMAEATYWWHPTWFPIAPTGAGGVLACDCSVEEGEPTPIHFVDWGKNESFFEPAAASFGEMVGWWIEAFDIGAWNYDPKYERWHYRWELLDPAVELTGVV